MDDMRTGPEIASDCEDVWHDIHDMIKKLRHGEEGVTPEGLPLNCVASFNNAINDLQNAALRLNVVIHRIDKLTAK